MRGSLGRCLRGIVTMTLSLLIVAGPATAALADGGPDRVLPTDQQISPPRLGFGDHIQPARPGFGDRIPAPPVQGAPEAPVVATQGERAGGGNTIVLLVGMVAGLSVLTAAAAWFATGRRRRPRLAH